MTLPNTLPVAILQGPKINIIQEYRLSDLKVEFRLSIGVEGSILILPAYRNSKIGRNDLFLGMLLSDSTEEIM